MNENLQNYILKRSIPEPNSGCWLWTYAMNSWGYGHAKLNGKYQRGNRISYEAFVCDPGDQFVLHKCDNRLCVNPEHLYAGSREDNTRDMLSRNRQARGDRNSSAKLSLADVDAIRTIPDRQYERSALANKYGVTPETISRIRYGSRKSWGWVEWSGAPRKFEKNVTVKYREDLSGRRFGMLVAKYRIAGSAISPASWACECDCGRKVKVATSYLKRAKSCGCSRLKPGLKLKELV